MYKLIKQGLPHIPLHHYRSNTQRWGHSMQGFDTRDADVHFDELITYSATGSCFSEVRLERGDMITRDMSSGKIGLFEIQSVSHSDGYPRDYYSFVAHFCGYLDGNTLKIHSGYGILEKTSSSRARVKLTTIVLIGLALLAILLLSLIANGV